MWGSVDLGKMKAKVEVEEEQVEVELLGSEPREWEFELANHPLY